MEIPKWKGGPHEAGTYKFHILWFRVALATVFGFVAGVASTQLKALPFSGQSTCASKSCSSAVHNKGNELAAVEPVTEDFPDFVEKISERDLILTRSLESKLISLKFENNSLDFCLQHLREQGQVNIVLTPGARDLADSEDLSINLKLKDVSLKNCLQLILASNSDLDYQLREGVVVVGVNYEFEAPLLLEFYNIRDLIIRPRNSGIAAEKFLELCESTLGDDFEEGSLEIAGTVLAVRKPAAGHKRIQALIKALRKPAPVEFHEPKWIDLLKYQLRSKTVSFSLKDVPLSEVLDQFQTQTSLPVVLSREVDGEELRVHFNVKDITAEHALTLMLEGHNLACGFRNNVLFVGQRDEVRDPCYMEVVDVSNLISQEDSKLEKLDPDQLQELLMNSTGEDHWEDPARIEYFNGRMIIRQTPTILKQIRGILKRLESTTWLPRDEDEDEVEETCLVPKPK